LVIQNQTNDNIKFLTIIIITGEKIILLRFSGYKLANKVFEREEEEQRRFSGSRLFGA